VRASGRDARLDVIGDGPDSARLQALAAELGLADAVRWHGRVANTTVLARMADAQAVIVNSRVETFSVVTGEALALGRPVIATRCGGPEQMVTEANGLLIPVDDSSALVVALCTVMDEPARYTPEQIRSSIAGKGEPAAIGNAFGLIYDRIKGHG
jgi:glycosyltransferase involved in cell wall biosynthesis